MNTLADTRLLVSFKLPQTFADVVFIVFRPYPFIAGTLGSKLVRNFYDPPSLIAQVTHALILSNHGVNISYYTINIVTRMTGVELHHYIYYLSLLMLFSFFINNPHLCRHLCNLLDTWPCDSPVGRAAG